MKADDSELLDKYLDRELSEKEQQLFESRMQADPAFAEEVEIALSLNLNHDIQLKRQWRKRLSEEKKTPPTKSRNIFFLLKVAAVVVLFLAGVGYYLHTKTLDYWVDKELAIIHLAPEVLRTEEADLPEVWKIVIAAYQQGNFEVAISTLEKLSSENSERISYQFYLGLCYLYQKQADYDKAIQSFKKIRKKENIYWEETSWFLALAYLKKGERSLAEDLLKEMLQTSTWKEKEIRKVLRKLN